MSQTVTIEHAARHLAELVSALTPGDEITLTSKNQPIARIVPAEARPVRRRQGGAGQGRLIVLQEDDEHLKDFQEYMR